MFRVNVFGEVWKPFIVLAVGCEQEVAETFFVTYFP
jgi:hypothetical protein